MRALRLTYPFVFIDEFQDTTYCQYDFLLTAFADDRITITAVGDEKQRIMAWAGARDDVFGQFQVDFQSLRVPLVFNFRSSPELVRIQHVVARALDPGAIAMQAMTLCSIDGDVAAVWAFHNELREAEQIAEWLASDMRARSTKPRDYAVLVRQTANLFEQQLAPSFAIAGLELRNESAVLGRTTLQDLLAEEITRLTLALLRLGAWRRQPEAWIIAATAIRRAREADLEDRRLAGEDSLAL